MSFNELVNGWHADHIYKHDPTAIEAFTLLAFLAYNLFHAFLACNLKLRRVQTGPSGLSSSPPKSIPRQGDASQRVPPEKRSFFDRFPSALSPRCTGEPFSSTVPSERKDPSTPPI